MNSELLTMQTFCLVCCTAIPEGRARRRSNTCGDECRKKLRRFYDAQRDARGCRHCGKPSTPEQRKQFQDWRRASGLIGKRGRPAKKQSPAEMPMYFCNDCQIPSETEYCGKCGADTREQPEISHA